MGRSHRRQNVRRARQRRTRGLEDQLVLAEDQHVLAEAQLAEEEQEVEWKNR